jgi:excisionase family DNA binding protein
MSIGKLLTVAEAAAICGVGEATIYNWVTDGKMPHIKLGRIIRFDERVLGDWLIAQMKGTK